MAATVSRKLKRKSEDFYARKERGEGESGPTKRKKEDLVLQVSTC